jgi:hypothetical protein
MELEAKGWAVYEEPDGFRIETTETDWLRLSFRSVRCVSVRLRVGLGSAYALAEQVTHARGTAETGLRQAIEAGERGHEAYPRHLLGLVSGQEGNVPQSTQSLGEALVLATELGMRPLVAHCHLGLGRLDRRTGNNQQAQEHLTTATAMYREMGMTYWLDQAEAEMKESG